jgi:hypothetical protein
MLASFDTTLNADSVESLPSNRSIVACCTYQLQEDSSKCGAVSIIQVASNALNLQSNTACDAIFDSKW